MRIARVLKYGGKISGKTDALLDDSLMRLYQADFAYSVPGTVGRSRLVSCIERFNDEEKLYDYRVSISDGVAALLDGGEWLVLLGKEREQLASDPLAKGLHAFYTSHRSAFPMFPSTLKALMGRDSMQDSKWLHALDKALVRVREATKWVQCEVVKVGPYAGKVVVQKGYKPRKRAKKTSIEDTNISDKFRLD
ncbi:plasmid replication initiator TrfA [Acidovorax sp. SRB_14]|uniref:plasmid replication initiator TrfA n=1 Tax=Acidovorax sp. SRB_14 TaxID=1962699 RepID=UPI001567518B|nr:plasmid replication initiator TrfA [Acidovorax sp. SRB_14]